MAAIAGPVTQPTCPAPTPGQLCRPKTASHGKRVNRPSSIIFFAPAPSSSAGWKIRCSVPRKLPASARKRAAASRIAVWPSWPQACITPAFSLAYGRPVASWIGSASMSARMPRLRPGPRRSVPTTPVPARPVVTS
ncbi:hypothetical protein D3C85_274200 [compost metagenome]